MSIRDPQPTTSWSFDGANDAFVFDPPQAGAAAPVTFARIIKGTGAPEALKGTSRSDWLRGQGGDDVVSGGGGHDSLDGGSGADIVSGASGNDTILGASGVDILDGGTGNDIVSGGGGTDLVHGGKGNDVLTGGSGKDVFWFETALSATRNLDQITDFSVRDDTIAISNAVFKRTGPDDSILKAGAFRKGSQALDGSDRIIYDPATGALFYDRDGSGAAAQVQFAQLKANLALSQKDFLIV